MLALDTSKWAQTLWRSHLTHSQPARTLVAAGQQRQSQFDGFADDLHGALYLRQAPPVLPDAPAWATTLLAQAQDLAEWKPLKARCMHSGFAAGVGTEVLLRALVALTPQADDPQEGEQDEGGEEGGTGDGARRRVLRRAMREAGTAIDEAQGALEGLEDALGIRAGTQPGQDHSLVELEQVRALWEVMGKNKMLQMIAQMAGRLERLAHSTKRSRGQARVGAIRGVTIGGDLARILPEELAGLRGGRLARLMTLGKIAGRKALQYDVTGEVPQTRGPLLVLLDKSSSMRSPFTRLLWSKAVALALLSICREQGRTWGCVTFDAALSQEVLAPGGQVTDQDALMRVLLEGASGGTDFDPPLSRALTLLAESPSLARADLILVTDGYAELSEEVRAALAARMAQDGLSLYAIGIGDSADLTPVKAVATACYQVRSDPQASDGVIAPMLAALA